MRLELGVTLVEARAQALRDLAAAAERERLRHLTPGVGKAAEYLAKEADAQAYAAAGYPRPFDGRAFPLLEAEMIARLSLDMDADARPAAERILAASGRCRRALAGIAAAEGVARQCIRSAETHAEIRDALRVVWPAG